MYFFAPFTPPNVSLRKGDAIALLAHENKHWQFSIFYNGFLDKIDQSGHATISGLTKGPNLLGEKQREVDYNSGLLIPTHSGTVVIPVNYIWGYPPSNNCKTK